MARVENIIIPAKFLILISHLLSCIVMVNTTVIIIKINELKNYIIMFKKSQKLNFNL
jgi:hypothetical protein